jgi:hypothetical protein
MDTVVTVVIKAILPNGAYHTLAFEKTTKMSKVLKAFCEKRSLMPHDYTLQSLTDPPTYITRDMRVSDLKEVGVRLVPKSGAQKENPFHYRSGVCLTFTASSHCRYCHHY